MPRISRETRIKISDTLKKRLAKITSEERKKRAESGLAGIARLTKDQRSIASRKGWAKFSQEQKRLMLAEFSRKGREAIAKLPPERLKARGKKAAAKLPKEKRASMGSAGGKKFWEKHSFEQRRQILKERRKKQLAKLSKEQRTAIGKKAAITRKTRFSSEQISEMSRSGAKKRWERIPKEKRSQIMRYVALGAKRKRTQILQLFEQNKALAFFLARKRYNKNRWDFENVGMALEDVEQEALLELYHVAQVFDPKRQVPFGAFAGKLISWRLNEIIDASRKLKRRGHVISLNQFFEEEYKMQLPSREIRPWQFIVETQDVRNTVIEIVNRLNFSDRDKKIFFERFGLLSGVPQTFGVVGEKFKLTRARIQQIVGKMVTELKKTPDFEKILPVLLSLT